MKLTKRGELLQFLNSGSSKHKFYKLNSELINYDNEFIFDNMFMLSDFNNKLGFDIFRPILNFDCIKTIFPEEMIYDMTPVYPTIINIVFFPFDFKILEFPDFVFKEYLEFNEIKFNNIFLNYEIHADIICKVFSLYEQIGYDMVQLLKKHEFII